MSRRLGRKPMLSITVIVIIVAAVSGLPGVVGEVDRRKLYRPHRQPEPPPHRVTDGFYCFPIGGGFELGGHADQLPPDREIFLERAVKEALHESGHIWSDWFTAPTERARCRFRRACGRSMGSRRRFARRVRGACGVREIRYEDSLANSGCRRRRSDGIRIPPLRERREHVPLLARHFMERLGHELGKDVADFSEGALKVLMDYNWPGNVRELENAVERAMVTCRERVLMEDDFAFLAESGRRCSGRCRLGSVCKRWRSI